ncbi:biopolymer transporter Tol [Arsenicicoccus dermatophilus]|uniref:biopolymer transporter Tol n=1 Tax=Arsenicicoccus dermatophilus TaxID=1076331 RepID=UPI00391719BB
MITDEREILLQSSELVLESPNFAPDGRHLVLNGGGRLRVLPLDPGLRPGGPLVEVATDPIRAADNDHLVTPDGSAHLLTADGRVYHVPWAGGTPRCVTPDPGTERIRYYLHGQSADGRTLALTVLTGRLHTDDVIRTDVGLRRDGEVRLLTDTEACDGPELGPGAPGEPHDAWVWFTSELAAERPGHSQVFRIRPDGGGLQQITYDDRVSWFPHPSPDGRWLAHLAYEPGTRQHPADVPAQIRLIDLTDPALGTHDVRVRVLADVFGGQGATNINGWAPDLRRLAYVDYPLGRDQA